MKTKPRSTLAPRGSGTLLWIGEHRFVRVSMPDGTRPRFRLCAEVCKCKEMSDARARATGDAIAERERADMAKALESESRRDRGKRLTVKEFGEQWTSGKLYEKHGEVNRLRVKASAKDDEYRLKKYVYKKLGNTAVADVTEQDIEDTLAEANRKAKGKSKGTAWRSKFQLYQVMRRLFDLAVMPGRIRKDNPVTSYMRPTKPKPPLFGYLYPSELIALLHCDAVPVARRVLYALAIYTGLRKGSLYALTWGSLDFTNGTLTSLVSKTGLPQMFEANASLMKMLALWFEYQGRPDSKVALVARADREATDTQEAQTLRDDLTAAGVTRSALHDRAPNSSPLRFHDLRATFVTWAMREGRGEGWISDRTGHLSAEMRNRYARAARTLLDLNYVPFPDLSEAIPALLERRNNVVSLVAAGARTVH